MKLQFKKYWLTLSCVHAKRHVLENANALFQMLKEHTEKCQTESQTSTQETGHDRLLGKLIRTNLKWYDTAKKNNTTKKITQQSNT